MNKSSVPKYRLYREIAGEAGSFWLHCEILSHRSRLHNWEISQHQHETLFQIFILEKGQGELLYGSRRQSFEAPCAMYISPRSPHGFRYTHNAEGIVLTVLEDRLPAVRAVDPAIANFLSEPRVISFNEVGEEGNLISSIAARIHEEFLALRPGSNILLDAMTTEIVIRLARIGTIPETKDLHSNTRQRDRSRMHALTELITVHGREHQPVVFYSEKLGLSVPHLNRIARREAGASVQELAALHLVRAAKRDLLFTPASVSAIAYSLGFQDPAYFNRFFKRQTGITPGQFRIQERHQASVKETKTGKSTNSYSLPD